jgi:hypothetical protein
MGNFFLLSFFQNRSSSHPASFPILKVVIGPETELNEYHPSSTKVKNRVIITFISQSINLQW